MQSLTREKALLPDWLWDPPEDMVVSFYTSYGFDYFKKLGCNPDKNLDVQIERLYGTTAKVIGGIMHKSARRKLKEDPSFLVHDNQLIRELATKWQLEPLLFLMTPEDNSLEEVIKNCEEPINTLEEIVKKALRNAKPYYSVWLQDGTKIGDIEISTSGIKINLDGSKVKRKV